MKFKFSNPQFWAMAGLLVSANLFVAAHNTVSAKPMASSRIGNKKVKVIDCYDDKKRIIIAHGNSCIAGPDICVTNGCPI